MNYLKNTAKFIGLVLFLIVVLLCILVFTPENWLWDSQAQVERIRAEIPQAQARWQAHQITHYNIDARVYIHSGPCGKGGEPTTLKIRYNQLVIPPYDTENPTIADLEELCQISSFLPPKLFAFLDKELSHLDTTRYYVTVDFDPEYGYMSSYSFRSTIPGGQVFYKFDNFQPITKW